MITFIYVQKHEKLMYREVGVRIVVTFEMGKNKGKISGVLAIFYILF